MERPRRKMGDFIAMDLAATGQDPKLDQLIEISGIKYRNFSIDQVCDSLIRPGDLILEGGYKDKISGEILARAKEPRQLLDYYMSFIEDLPLIGYDLPRKIGFLEELYSDLIGREYRIANPVLDIRDLVRELYPNLGAYDLWSLVKFLKIQISKRERSLDSALVASYAYVDYLTKKSS